MAGLWQCEIGLAAAGHLLTFGVILAMGSLSGWQHDFSWPRRKSRRATQLMSDDNLRTQHLYAVTEEVTSSQHQDYGGLSFNCLLALNGKAIGPDGVAVCPAVERLGRHAV